MFILLFLFIPPVVKIPWLKTINKTDWNGYIDPVFNWKKVHGLELLLLLLLSLLLLLLLL